MEVMFSNDPNLLKKCRYQLLICNGLFSLILEPPSFIRELVPTDVVKGSSASFQCQVAGTGPFEIQWHKDAKEIKPSTKHCFSQTNGTMGLEVHKCEAVDVGEYQCTVANEVGSCTCKTTLSLKGWSDKSYKSTLSCFPAASNN